MFGTHRQTSYDLSTILSFSNPLLSYLILGCVMRIAASFVVAGLEQRGQRVGVGERRKNEEKMERGVVDASAPVGGMPRRMKRGPATLRRRVAHTRASVLVIAPCWVADSMLILARVSVTGSCNGD